MLRAFAPIETADSTILILGSMPSETSLRLGQYYAHATNAFWPIMARLYARELNCYDEKVALLKEQDIALWDVLACCTRIGSADSAIHNPQVNDFDRFWQDHVHLRLICCNGQTAMRLFLRYVGTSHIPYQVTCIRLPSTSAANTMPFDEKYAAWEKALRGSRLF